MEQSAQQKQSYFSTTRIAFIAMFSTLTGLLYVLKFSMPFAFPGFLEFKFADIPVLISAFALGPSSGAITATVGIFIKLVIKGTSTAFVGDLSDLVTSCVFAVTAGVIYRKHRTFKGALCGMAIGTAAEVIIALLFNRLALVPFYVQAFFHGNWQPLINMMTPLFPSCTKETFYNFYLWVSVLPFNLMRCIVASAVTLLVYKRISRMINKINRKIYPDAADGSARAFSKTDITVIIVAVVLAALLVLFALLRYFVFD